MKYKAFLSYSHHQDSELAPSLEKGLEKFAKPTFKRRAMEIFRDANDLSASPNLWGKIEGGLANSEFFIFLASQTAAQSRWCKKEVEFWRTHKSMENFLVVLTDGELYWDETKGDFDWTRTTAIPDNLSGAFVNEPLYVDFRGEYKSEDLTLEHPEFKSKLVLLAATLQGKSVGDMVGKAAQQHKKTLRIRNGAIALLLAMLSLSIFLTFEAKKQTKIAQLEKQRAIDSSKVAMEQRQIAKDSANSALQQRQIAQDSAKSARIQREKAENQSKVAENQRKIAIYEKNNAIEQRIIAEASLLRAKASKDRDVNPGRSLRYLELAADKLPFDLNIKREFLDVYNNNLFAAQVTSFFEVEEDYEGELTQPSDLDRIKEVSFSPDMTRLIYTDQDYTRIWDLDGELHYKSYYDVNGTFDMNDDGSIWLVFDPMKKIITIESKDSFLAEIETGYYAKFLNISDSKELVIAGSHFDDDVKIWDFKGELIQRFKAYDAALDIMALSPDGTKLFTATDDNEAALWSLDGSLIHKFENIPDKITSAAFSPADPIIFMTFDDGSGELRALESNYIRKFPNLKASKVNSDPTSIYGGAAFGNSNISNATFSKDGSLIAVSSKNKVFIWDIFGNSKYELKGQTKQVRAIKFTKDGGAVYTASEDYMLRKWILKDKFNGELGHKLVRRQVKKFVISKDENSIITLMESGQVIIYNKNGNRKRTIKLVPDSYEIILAPDDKHFLMRSDGVLYLLNFKGNIIKEQSDIEARFYNFVDGGKSVLFVNENDVYLWDLTSDKLEKIISNWRNGIDALITGINSEVFLLSSEHSTSIELFDLNGKSQMDFEPESSMAIPRVSNNGTHIIYVEQDTVYIKDIYGKIIIKKSFSDYPVIHSVNFSPDGNLFLIEYSGATPDEIMKKGQIKIFDINGNLVYDYKFPYSSIFQKISFSSDGSRVYSWDRSEGLYQSIEINQSLPELFQKIGWEMMSEKQKEELEKEELEIE